MAASIENGSLSVNGRVLLDGIGEAFSLGEETPDGVCLRLTPTAKGCYARIPLGKFHSLNRLVACHRVSPFWVAPKIASVEADVPVETFWIIGQTRDADYVLLAVMLDAPNRYALCGEKDGLGVTVETGHTGIPISAGSALFVAVGKCPYTLAERAAAQVSKLLGISSIRRDKPALDFADHLGWCTWDAFYHAVTPEGVLSGLESFDRDGVSVPLLILDDGWQDTTETAMGDKRLASFLPNEKFGRDLSPLVAAAKQQHGVKEFFVWHALMGYWAGVAPETFQKYEAEPVPRAYGPGVLALSPTWNVVPWGAALSIPSKEGMKSFYTVFHKDLASQGVDGVKVDAQALFESVAYRHGDRVTATANVRRLLDASVDEHFDGKLINCMSCTPECAYLAKQGVMRSSDDFFPNQPQSHGMHIFTNAHVGVWFGEFIPLDWDMFHTSHAMGSFHAAARAISGGPVYFSDPVGKYDVALLRKLSLRDGFVLRTEIPVRPTLDSLFADPFAEQSVFKIFSVNRCGGVVGLFGLSTEQTAFEGTVSPHDIPNFTGARHVGYCHSSGELWLAAREDRRSIALGAKKWEIVSFSPVEHDFAPIGLPEKFNSGWAIASQSWESSRQLDLGLRGEGVFLAWAKNQPESVSCEGHALPFDYETASGRLSFSIPGELSGSQPRTYRIEWK